MPPPQVELQQQQQCIPLFRRSESFLLYVLVTLMLLTLRFVSRTTDFFLAPAAVLLIIINNMSSTTTTTTTDSHTTKPQENDDNEPVFSLLVTLQFTTHAAKEAFEHEFARLAQYVRQHEPETRSYQVLCHEQDDLQLLILERYVHKERSYLQIHKTSPAFLQFRPQLAAWQQQGLVTITGQSYRDAKIGFMDRPPRDATSPSPPSQPRDDHQQEKPSP